MADVASLKNYVVDGLQAVEFKLSNLSKYDISLQKYLMKTVIDCS